MKKTKDMETFVFKCTMIYFNRVEKTNNGGIFNLFVKGMFYIYFFKMYFTKCENRIPFYSSLKLETYSLKCLKIV